jgi:hypothetical protein
MSTLFLLLGIVFALSLVPLALVLTCRYLSFREGRSLVCPFDYSVETVKVNAGRAAWTSLTGDPELLVASCSRRPRQSDCGQSCLVQFEAERDPLSASTFDEAEVSRLPG